MVTERVCCVIEGVQNGFGYFWLAEVGGACFGRVEKVVHEGEGFFRGCLRRCDVSLGREASVESPGQEDGLVEGM